MNAINLLGFVNNLFGLDGMCCLFIPFALIGVGLLVFWVWMLVDVVQNEPSEGNDKMVWVLIVVLAGWVGGLIYYFVRRPERIRKYGR